MSLFKKTPPPAYVPPKTVASITEGLSTTLSELEEHAEHQKGQAAFQESVAARALANAEGHKAESELATKVAGNIRALLNA